MKINWERVKILGFFDEPSLRFLLQKTPLKVNK